MWERPALSHSHITFTNFKSVRKKFLRFVEFLRYTRHSYYRISWCVSLRLILILTLVMLLKMVRYCVSQKCLQLHRLLQEKYINEHHHSTHRHNEMNNTDAKRQRKIYFDFMLSFGFCFRMLHRLLDSCAKVLYCARLPANCCDSSALFISVLVFVYKRSPSYQDSFFSIYLFPFSGLFSGCFAPLLAFYFIKTKW